jgi:hypothetical protein
VSGHRRRVAATVLVLAGAVSACERDDTGLPDDGWDPDAQFAPSLRPAFGARVDDGRLRFTTGSPCRGVTRLRIVFDPGSSRSTEAVLTAPAPGVVLEEFDPTGAVEGFAVEQALPDGFDWTAAEEATFGLEGVQQSWGAWVELDQVRAGSDEHPEDTFWFQDVGWLDPAAVAERDGVDFLTTCTADPEVD